MQSGFLAIVQDSIIFLYKYCVLVALYKVSASEGVWCVHDMRKPIMTLSVCLP